MCGDGTAKCRGTYVGSKDTNTVNVGRGLCAITGRDRALKEVELRKIMAKSENGDSACVM